MQKKWVLLSAQADPVTLYRTDRKKFERYVAKVLSKIGIIIILQIIVASGFLKMHIFMIYFILIGGGDDDEEEDLEDFQDWLDDQSGASSFEGSDDDNEDSEASSDDSDDSDDESAVKSKPSTKALKAVTDDALNDKKRKRPVVGGKAKRQKSEFQSHSFWRKRANYMAENGKGPHFEVEYEEETAPRQTARAYA